MAEAVTELPEGFELEKPAAGSAELPPGFEVEKHSAAHDLADRATKDVVQGVAGMLDIPGSVASIVPDAMTAAARGLGYSQVKDMEPLPRLSGMAGDAYDAATGGETPQAKSLGGRIFDAAVQTASGGVAGGARKAADIARTAVAGATGQGAAEVAKAAAPDSKLAQEAAMLAGGAGGTVAAHGAGKVATKIGNAREGVLPEHYQQLKDAADNIDPSGKLWDSLSVGQVTQNKLAQKVEAGMQLVPSILGGTGKQVKNLQEMTNKAAEDFTAQQFDKVINTNFNNYKQIADAAADDTHPMHGQAIGALKILDSAGDDVGTIMQASKKASDFRNEFIAQKLYTARDQLIEKVGGAVKLDKTQAELDNGIGELRNIGTAETDKFADYLEKYKQRLPLPEEADAHFLPKNWDKYNYLSNKSATPALDTEENHLSLSSGVPLPERNDNAYSAVRNGGYQEKPFLENVDYRTLRKKNEVLSDYIDQLDNGGKVDTNSRRILVKIAEAQKADMANYIAGLKDPKITAAVERSDTFYKNKIVPQRARYFNALDNTEPGSLPDKVYGSLIEAGNHGRDTAQAFYNNLEQKGRAAVRYSMVDEAVQKATDAKGNVSPEVVSGYLHDIRQARAVFFKGQDKWEMDGFTNLMNHMQVGYKPGSTMKVGAGGAEAYLLHALGWTGGAATVGATHGLRWLLTSPKGKAFMLASSDLKPGSPAMSNLTQKIVAQMKVEAGQVGQTKNP